LRGATHLIAKTFILQKTIVRIMAGVKTINSFKSPLKRLEILTLSCEHIFSLMNFTVNNQEHFRTNSAINSVNARKKNQLHTDCQPLMFSEVLIMLTSKLSTVYHLVSNVL
jgi:hypothetical protein